MRTFGFAAAVIDKSPTFPPSPEPPPTSGYAAIVADPAGLGNGGPLAYWRCSDDSAIVDQEAGSRDGTWSATPTLVQGLPQNSDQAVYLTGGVGGSIPNDAGLQLSAFTLSIWFEFHSLPTGGNLAPIFTKDASGLNQDDLNIAVGSDGEVSVAFQSSAATFTILPGVIDLDTPNHLVLRADATGFDATLNGVVSAKDTNHTTAWASNTQPIRFADAQWQIEDSDVEVDEVALYSRVLTEAEVISLAQRQSAPVTAADDATVPESDTTVIDVTSNDTWVGTKVDLTVTIVDDSEVTAAGHSVSVNLDNDIEFVASAVSSNEVVNFTYKITDANGESNVSSVQVTVEASDFVPLSNANPYDFTTGDTVEVASMAALQTAVNGAPSGGRQVLLLTGTGVYAGGSLSFTRSGTGPVVIRPKDGRGAVTINDASWSMATGSSKIVITNFYLNGPSIALNGANHRVTRNRIRQMDGQTIRVQAATDWRVDHNDVAEYLSGTASKRFVFMDHNSVRSGAQKRGLVDRNYCHDVNPAVGNNGLDFIGLGFIDDTIAQTDPELVVEYNLFLRINLPGDGELLGSKCSGIKFRFNTVEDCGSVLYINGPRGGENFEARSNWFEGNSNSNILHGFSDGLLIIGNRWVGSGNFWVGAGNTYYNNSAPAGGYEAARAAQIIGNRMGSGNILVGGFWSSTPDVAALNNNLWENTRDSGGDAHTLVSGTLSGGGARHSGTTFNDPGADPQYDYVAAVKIATPTQQVGDTVGMFAADPYDPDGPQS